MKKNTASNKSMSDITIVTTAAFAFSIVSWKATAEGLQSYVFTNGWEAALISFAIQSILFVLNIKLPFYFHKIGQNTRTNHTKKITHFQTLLLVFYFMILSSSSFFSFVYICNNVVYKHQSGYTDDDTLAQSKYTKILSETKHYIRNASNAKRILANEYLNKIQSEYALSTTQTQDEKSLDELNILLNNAETAQTLAKEEYETAKADADSLKQNMDSYAQQRANTTWHDRQNEWESKYQSATNNWNAAITRRDTKKSEYEKAVQAYVDAQNAVKYYHESSQTLVTNLLAEMLKEAPNPDTLNTYITNLNTDILDKESFNNTDDYAKLVEYTQKLSILISDYTKLQNYLHDSVKIENSTTIAIPDPKAKTYHKQYKKWKNTWNKKLSKLNSIIQNLPTISSSEKERLHNNSAIDSDLFETYIPAQKSEELTALKRNKFSDINVIEKTLNLLTGKYRMIAWFSLVLAIFFDLSSLLAGLFLYGIQKKSVPASTAS